MAGRLLKSVGLVIGFYVMISSPAVADTAAPQPLPDMLPDRYLSCVLGRSTNLDPQKEQKASDIVLEGRHEFALRLPPIAKHSGAPPEPTDIPEPVDPRTAVLSDPDGLTQGVAAKFSRVIDLWPRRVEMIAPVVGMPLYNMIILDTIDPVTKRARLFMTRIKDAASMDLGNIYQGECQVSLKPIRAKRTG